MGRRRNLRWKRITSFPRILQRQEVEEEDEEKGFNKKLPVALRISWKSYM
uniref:Uncharacterized protein n=1 Tax=Rhizophora mucronata TaxID=61149 RepID=A0A2P2P638_RHIMU